MLKKNNIKDYIDRKILKNLPDMGYDGTRNDLQEIISRFAANVVEHSEETTVSSIEQIKDTRSRYLSFYIFFARKRIIDLYKIEARDWYGWSGDKKFKAILLKEKLSGNAE